MRNTGVVRKLDDLGRIVIPIELRRTLDIKLGDGLEIFTDADTIILRKYHPGCTFCNSLDGLKEFGGQHICRHCIDVLKKG